ncbi:probable ATP-dependent RNA helicase DDX60 [Pelobates cultripes]|uniref:Probable ATP-dependent RNA helicase DDX60 n=1 Tax=Pelobates cultripes TaxID=61616 RepID=A0AAD1SFL7_PELCU|nr:probable ATP-dependent RNA helicase DDX60 [Pelobates cultripes]
MASEKSGPGEDNLNSDTCSTDSDFLETDSSCESDSESIATTIHQFSEVKKKKGFLDKMHEFVTSQLSKALYASLLNDYVESEFFLIDGDSLLITCVRDETLKKGQDLHFFFLLERFLLNMKNKGAIYVVIFFEDMEHMYMGQSDLICLRTQLRLHLKENTDTVVHTFPSILSTEWKNFLLEECPYFLMASDEGINVHQTLFLQLVIINALGNKTNVVLTAGQENDHLRVYGYYVDSQIRHHAFMKKHLKTTSTISKLNPKSKIEAVDGRMNHPCVKYCRGEGLCAVQRSGWKMVQDIITNLFTILKEGSNIRTIITVVSCSLVLKLFSENGESFPLQKILPFGLSSLFLLVIHFLKDGRISLTMNDVADLCRMHCLTVAILLCVPLSQRSQMRHIKADWNDNASLFTDLGKNVSSALYIKVMRYKKRGSYQDLNWKIDWTNVSDLNDDLLLKNVAYYYEKETFTDLRFDFGSTIGEMYTFLWNTTLQLSPWGKELESSQIRTTSTPFLSNDSSLMVKTKKMPNAGLIPMRSALIETFAGDIMKGLQYLNSDDPVVLALNEAKPYDEILHWHSGKSLSDDYDRTKDTQAVQRKEWLVARKVEKSTEWPSYDHPYHVVTSSKVLLLHMGIINRSVTNDKILFSVLICMKKKDQIIQANQKKNKAKEENKELEQWRSMAIVLKKDIQTDFVSGIQKQEQFVHSLGTQSVKFCSELATLKTCVDVWHEHCKMKSMERPGEKRDTNIAVEIMKKIQVIMTNYKEMLQKEDLGKIAQYLIDLGFKNLACTLQPSKGASAQHVDLVKRFYYRSYTLFVGVGSSRFQMQYMGPYLLRDERTDPDPRVQHFIPDTWQRELLDVVDNNESAVIVAPTSSGKTYASYYCMEKVLRKSDTGVVVYVAPTKALVNQVVATVSNQFDKNLPSGMALCGVFTRDYRTDALNCQVLVTVPQCLEILLLSHRQNWAKKIEYIIFDEIHCLGGEIGAEVWEHMLVMIRCPFLALSATISNPEHLTAWLQTVKQYWKQSDELIGSTNLAKGANTGRKSKTVKTRESYRVRLVLHDKRFNDLEKYMCSVQEGKINFESYHPCAALTTDHIKKHGIPNDLSFSPRESIRLYDTMVTAWPEWPRVKDYSAEENICFKDKLLITKNDANKYEDILKKELIIWLEKGQENKTKKVLEYLRIVEHPNQVNCKKYFPMLVEELRKDKKLPALFFAFSLDLVEYLVSESSKVYFNKRLGYRDQSERRKILSKKAPQSLITRCLLHSMGGTVTQSVNRSVDGNSDVTEDQGKASSLAHRCALQKHHGRMFSNRSPGYAWDGKEYLKDRGFCIYAFKESKLLSETTFITICEKVRNEGKGTVLKSLAKIGVGYHHASMKPKERFLVEMLFRLGYVRYSYFFHYKVVTATGSLALGINMPCKSVVFLHDSIYLDALNYRQMSGRAGRRGQDLLGNVFFFTIPTPKVKKLLKSNVPQLKGQFPLSISLVLRVMLLAARADDTEDAKAKALSILKHSLMSFKQPVETQMLQLYCLFSLHYLIHEGYLDQDCNPMAFTGLATHLHFHEPSNFVFVNFLEKNLFHEFCQPCEKDPKQFPSSVMEKLVLILANLFGRSYFLQRPVKAHHSKVFLDNLPDTFSLALTERNMKVAEVFGCCLLAAAKLADMTKEYQLPLSQINFSGQECKDSHLLDHLIDSTVERNGISPFACLSGKSNHDLIAMENANSLMLQTAQIPDKYIPILNLEKTDGSGRKMLLNAYALDFFKHGSLLAIVKDNGFNEGDAYYKLKDFTLSISAISVSLREMCKDENDPVVLAFEQLQREYREKLDAV